MILYAAVSGRDYDPNERKGKGIAYYVAQITFDP